MTALCEDLSSDELAVLNETIRSVLILTAGHPPERRAMIAVHAAAQITGVVMAVGGYPERSIDGQRLDLRSRAAFEETKSRAYIHAFDERVNGPRSVTDVFQDWMGEGRISKGDVAQRALLSMP